MSVELKEIILDPFTPGRLQRDSCSDTRIKSDSSYLVKIDKRWYAGRFSEQWYGWNFDNWGCGGIQLDSIKGPLYEIVDSN
jgi:hypothetical protein